MITIIVYSKAVADIQRNTIQRQIVLDALSETDTHPTVDEIFAGLHKKHPSISKTTVYRNLRQLAANGTIRQVSLPDGLERYDGRAGQHHHFRCRACGAISDVDIGYSAEMDEMVRRKYSLDVEKHDIVFNGLCQKCSAGRPDP